MIRYLSYLIFAVLLVIIQTSIIPYMPAVLKFYDFLVPLAVYFSLYKPVRQGLPVLIAGGIIMDMLSAAPIGIYLTTYLWVFLAFRPIARWVGIKDHLLFSMLAVIGILFENFIFAIAVIFDYSQGFFTVETLQVVLMQVLWTVVTAPFFWLGLSYCFSDQGRVTDE